MLVPSVRIEIWSDVICPWCYLGSRRLSEALGQLALDDVELRWRSFQLDPGAPREPSDLRASLDLKYGPGAFDSMTPRLTALGAQVGIDYRFDKALRVNTADAHRSIAWAATQGAALPGGPQDLLVQTLFRSYFTDGADLCDQSVLVAAAREVGLDADAAGEALASDEFAAAVSADQAEAVERGITGVPAFVIDDQWLIPGAQEVDQMVRLLSRVGGKEQARR
ncbi:MAG: DsbA family oxidoreductase [Microthrixaceae bacterium]